jgi:hypothetical protein
MQTTQQVDPWLINLWYLNPTVLILWLSRTCWWIQTLASKHLILYGRLERAYHYQPTLPLVSPPIPKLSSGSHLLPHLTGILTKISLFSHHWPQESDNRSLYFCCLNHFVNFFVVPTSICKIIYLKRAILFRTRFRYRSSTFLNGHISICRAVWTSGNRRKPLSDFA